MTGGQPFMLTGDAFCCQKDGVNLYMRPMKKHDQYLIDFRGACLLHVPPQHTRKARISIQPNPQHQFVDQIILQC